MTLRQRLDRLHKVLDWGFLAYLESGSKLQYKYGLSEQWKDLPCNIHGYNLIFMISNPLYEWRVQPKQYRQLTPKEMADFLGTEVLCGERVLKINGIHLDFIDLNSITHFVYVGYTDMMTVPRYSDGQLVFRKEVT